MCVDCWNAAGRPANWSPAVAKALALTRELYEIHSTGGPLHAEVDDWNVDEGVIVPAYSFWSDEDLDEVRHTGRSTRQVCDELAAVLNAMPVDDRFSVLAFHDGLAEEPVSRPAAHAHGGTDASLLDKIGNDTH